MNDKMTFHRIADSIAAATGGTAEEAAMFLRAMLDKLADALARGEKVYIKGIGTFAPGETAQEAVLWAPDQELADAVNEPFAAFEAVPLAGGISEQQLSRSIELSGITEPASLETESLEQSASSEPVSPVDAPSVAEQPEAVPSEPEISSGVEQSDTIETVVSVEPVDPAPAPVPSASGRIETQSEPEVVDNTDAAPYSESTETSAPVVEPSAPAAAAPLVPEPKIIYRRVAVGPNPWMMLLIGVVVGLCMGYFLGMNFGYLQSSVKHDSVDDEIEMIEEEEADVQAQIDEVAASDDNVAALESESVAPVAAAPEKTANQPESKPSAPKVITDTVDKHNYLTTMARKYYGNHCFWVYIYEENSAILKNPDLIRPGTVVVIPPAEKYGIDASDPESVRRATAKIGEIERRFKGKR